MAKNYAVQIAAAALAAFVLALPAARSSFAEDGRGADRDRAVQNAAGQPGTSAPTANDRAVEGATKPNGQSGQKSPDTPAKLDAHQPPDAERDIVPGVARRDGSDERAHAEDLSSTGARSAAKGASLLNGPAPNRGAADAPNAIPLEWLAAKPNLTGSGKKPFKIVTPDKFPRQLSHAEGTSTGTVRNAIGLPIVARSPGGSGQEADNVRDRAAAEKPGTGRFAATRTSIGPTRGVGSNRIAIEPPLAAGSISGTGLIRPASTARHTGGTANVIVGISGNVVRLKR